MVVTNTLFRSNLIDVVRIDSRPNGVVDVRDSVIEGTVATLRRYGASRRVELDIGRGRERIEIEIPTGYAGPLRGRLAVKPCDWRIYADVSSSECRRWLPCSAFPMSMSAGPSARDGLHGRRAP